MFVDTSYYIKVKQMARLVILKNFLPMPIRSSQYNLMTKRQEIFQIFDGTLSKQNKKHSSLEQIKCATIWKRKNLAKNLLNNPSQNR